MAEHCTEIMRPINNEIQAQPDQHQFISLIERLATNPDVDVSKLEKMMNLQERILDRDAEQAFNADMVRCQNAIRTVRENQRNNQTNSRYADLEAITRAAKPIYTENGFALSFYEGETQKENHIRICVDVMHRQGHTKSRHVDMAIDDTGAKGAPTKTKIHGEGSSISYGRRYLTCMVFNIPTGDDDDGNKASGAQYINEDQQTSIKILLSKAYDDDPNLISKFFEHIGCTGLNDIPASDFQKHKAALSAIAAKRAK